MKLEYLYLDGYKGLKKLAIRFPEQSAPVEVNFLIGRNGSGKSRVLEAVGLIFTRIMQEELPGFSFEIRYRMPDGAKILVKPQASGYRDDSGRRRKLYVRVEKDGNASDYHAVPDEYLPSQIISYCSGANNSMEAILISSPRDALASDFYDMSIRAEEERNSEEIEEMRSYYEQLTINPRVLYLDAVLSKIILPVLFSFIPIDMQYEENIRKLTDYYELRNMLVKRLNTSLIPVAFSFQVNEELLERYAGKPQINLLRGLLKDSRDKSSNLNSWVIARTSSDEMAEDGSMSMESVAVFLYSRYDNSNERSFYQAELQKFCKGDPFYLISMLLTAYRDGVIKEINFLYSNHGKKGLYRMTDLSDGELMWLARTGLILLAQSDYEKNMLFLYDEPDVHFNDDWNRDFINIIYELGKDTQNAFLIATHSTLILTDALYEQVTLLDSTDDGGAEIRDINISTFAAQRDEISRQIFGTDIIGKYAANSVNDMMKEVNLEKIKDNIVKLGPGYQRFQMYEAYYSLADKEQK